MSNQESVRVLIVENRYLVGEMLKGLLEDMEGIPSSGKQRTALRLSR